MKRQVDAESDGPELTIRWFGTAAHTLELGNIQVLTDPFFTYHGAMRVLFGQIGSNPERVSSALKRMSSAPDAMFIGHSHYDHMLDLAEILRQLAMGTRKVEEHADRQPVNVTQSHSIPVFGSSSTRNLLCGYGHGLVDHWRPTDADGLWHEVPGVAGLSYLAVKADHAPHFDGVVLYNGSVERCPCRPPTRARQFRLGDTYVYCFRLATPEASFTVLFVGAATSLPEDFPSESIGPVDVAILCVPAWRNVRGYPDGLIRVLQPRVIIPSHFDNFLDPSGPPSRTVVTAHLPEFLAHVLNLTDYPRFERILLPGIGATMRISPTTN